MLYVKMLDKGFSGWGMAEGKKSIYVIQCQTSAQAQAVAKAAHKRPEMTAIKIQTTMPQASDTCVITTTEFGQLSGPWLEFFPTAAVDDSCYGDERYYAND